MPYIGNTPADKFLTLAKQNFSTSATTSYTLDSAVSSTQDIALFINNVRQSPVDAYTVSGTALTLTSATAGTDEMYCVYLGKTVGTVSPASDSVTTAMLQANSVTGAKLNTDVISAQTALGATPADTDELLVSDAGVLKRVDYSYLKTSNTPAFLVAQSSNQSISNTTNTTLTFGTEHVDTDSAFASNKFTVPSGQAGLYVFTLTVQGNGNMGGSGGGVTICRYDSSDAKYTSGGGDADGNLNQSISSVNGYALTVTYKMLVGDYVNAAIYQASGSTQTTYAPRTFFGGHKLIGT